jgi:hypothetical protein
MDRFSNPAVMSSGPLIIAEKNHSKTTLWNPTRTKANIAYQTNTLRHIFRRKSFIMKAAL